MKRTNYKSYLALSFMALAVIGGMTACSEESGFFDYRANAGTEGLGILPTVSESAQVFTRAESIVELMEKQLNTLDVFVEPVADAGTFLRQYHLTEPTEADLNLLAERWRNEGLEMGKNYNIYVATNNPLTTSNLDNVEALKALVYDEKTAGVAVIDDDNNIGWGTDATSGNIYKLYDAAATNSDRALTAEKEFMMDGIIKNWTPDPTTVDQVFDVTLNRAAAKIVLNVKFDAVFLKSLTHEKDADDNYTIEKADKDKIFITGSPAWRFSNFAFGAPVFAPDTQGDGVEVHNSGFNIFHNQTFQGDDKHFQIITYTYPNKWEQANYATDAPSLVISIPYKQGDVTNYNYYRIPIVKKGDTDEPGKIERNHIYVINATIATRGSELHEDEDVIEDVNYAVLPWNDKSNSQAIHNEVQSVQHYYFNVNPKVYTLRGDGDQSVVLNYSKASGTKVNWKLFTINTSTGAKGAAVESTANNAVWGWFYNSNGAMQTSYNDGTAWNHMKVNIQQSTEGTSGTNGTVTVTSTALTNRAIKYMLLRVYLDEEETFDANGNPTYYEDILIRHFPTDNVQSFTGSWSSRYGAYEKVAGTGYGTNTQYFANPNNYIRTVDASYYDYWQGAPLNWDNYISEESAYAGANNYYYWRILRGYNWQGAQYTYYRARYQNATLRPVTWVDYENRINGTLSDDNFIAKVYSEGVMHRINPNSYNWIGNTNNLGGLDNNHMYVIQISATSDKYILGRPYINPATQQSNDDVVSPAFMIASQLGAVTPFEGAGTAAAEHCSTYMEVGTDGTRYTGWRLPTPAEIGVITEYQRGDINNVTIPHQYRVMAEVLTGSSYWALNNTEVETGMTSTYSGYVRCVRDLTAQEIEDLNGFERLQQQYQTRQ